MIPTAATTAIRPLAPGLVRDLGRILSPQAVFTDPDRLLVYESDGLTRYRRRPSAVVLPHDTETCARAVALLHGEGVPIVARGAGTGLSGGAVASAGSVVVGTARMCRILSVDAGSRRAHVQAGVVNAALADAARAHGLTYAPDPSSQTACTLGGNVAENSGGPHCFKYGVTSRYVRGLTVVGADGEVLELGGPAAAGGLDLVGLFVGSEGCFGIATEIELQLVPLPRAVRTLLAAFPRPEEAGQAVTAIIRAGLVPAALEIVDGSTIRAVEASIFAAGYPTAAGAALVVEFDGPEPGLDRDLDRAETCCREAGAGEIRRAHDDSERAALWKGRKKAFGALGRLAPDLLVQDATVPRSRLPEVLRTIGAIAAQHRLEIANVFHAGDGNLHPNLLFDRRDADQVARVERASREIMEACVAAGGTITGEHGVGLDKRAYMPLVHGPEELFTMAAVRRVFDPELLFNPGKVLPDEAETGRPEPGRRSAARQAEAGSAVSGVTPAWRGGGAPRVAEALGEMGVEVTSLEEAAPRAYAADTAAVGAVLRRASREGWRVSIVDGGRRGAGVGVVDLELSSERLTVVGEHEPADLTLRAGAGLSVAAAGAVASESGQWLAVDGLRVAERSLGSLVASGEGWALAGAFGSVRDQVLGLTVVSGDGRVLRLGGAVVKNVAGFDLVRLLVGSRGTLGMITEVTLRLHPRPEADRSLVVEAPELAALEPAVRASLGVPARAASIEGFSGGEGARLLVRATGSDAAVSSVLNEFRFRVGADAGLVDGRAALSLRGDSRAALASADARVRLWAPPSPEGWSRAVTRVRELMLELGLSRPASDPPEVRFLPEVGLVEAMLPADVGAGRRAERPLRAWARAGAAAGLGVQLLDSQNASARALEAAEASPPRRAARDRERQLRDVFDPQGVLQGIGGAT